MNRRLTWTMGNTTSKMAYALSAGRFPDAEQARNRRQQRQFGARSQNRDEPDPWIRHAPTRGDAASVMSMDTAQELHLDLMMRSA
jgi:hypothetical protein